MQRPSGDNKSWVAARMFSKEYDSLRPRRSRVAGAGAVDESKKGKGNPFRERARQLLQEPQPTDEALRMKEEGSRRIHWDLAAPRVEAFSIRFVWEGPAQRSVFLAGSFNNWQLPIPMYRSRDAPQQWECLLRLPRGVLHYKYVVDGAWAVDLLRPVDVVSEHGKVNKLLVAPLVSTGERDLDDAG